VSTSNRRVPAIAILVLVTVAAISIWAFVRRPGNLAG
jgi:hypothetical protein